MSCHRTLTLVLDRCNLAGIVALALAARLWELERLRFFLQPLSAASSSPTTSSIFLCYQPAWLAATQSWSPHNFQPKLLQVAA